MTDKKVIIKLALETIEEVVSEKPVMTDKKGIYFIKKFDILEKMFFVHNENGMKLLLQMTSLDDNLTNYEVNIHYATFFYCKDEQATINILKDIVKDFYHKADFLVHNMYVKDDFVELR